MRRLKEFFKSQTYPALSLALTVIGLMLFYAGRMNWIFIELTLGYEGILHLILPVLIFNAVLLCILTLLRQKNLTGEEKWYKAVLNISSLLSFFTVVFAVVYFIIALTGEGKYATLLYLKDTLLLGAFLALVPFSVLFLPKFQQKTRKVKIMMKFLREPKFST